MASKGSSLTKIQIHHLDRLNPAIRQDAWNIVARSAAVNFEQSYHIAIDGSSRSWQMETKSIYKMHC